MRADMLQPYISEASLEVVLYSLRSSKGDSGATRQELKIALDLERQLTDHRRNRAKEEAAVKERTEARAARAANAVLTPRQAMCLAAIRAGKGVRDVWQEWMGMPMWRGTRSMGGAVYRMVEAMIGEGLLTERRELTPEGRQRLESYEQKHGHVGP